MNPADGKNSSGEAELARRLRGVRLFSALDEAQLARLAARATVLALPRRGLFFTESDASRGLHVLLSGKVKLYRMSEEGKEQTIFLFGPGEPFCLCSVFSDGTLPANLAALEDSEVLMLDPAGFEALVREDPGLLSSVLRVLSRRLKEAMDMIDALSLRDVPSRLLAYFESRADDGGRVELDISYRELSRIVGVTPEALSRALRRMVEEGLIEMDGPVIRIL
ncbi:MAG: Crp/Fnr family transcriptional regulator [Desulfovibrionaceae bacterium]